MGDGTVPNGVKLIEPTDCERTRHVRENGSANDEETARRGRKKKPDIQIGRTVEIDEVYIVAGHKGQPGNVAKAGRPARKRRLKGRRGRGTSASEKIPVLGMVERGGLLILRAFDNVKRATIKAHICDHIVQGTVVNTDEYGIYNKVDQWGYAHKTVCHSDGEYARDDDGDGINEVHVNTQEGIWSVLRSWIRPHRGIAMKSLPTYLGFFEFVFNTRKRGKALISELMKTILLPDQREITDLDLSPGFDL